MLLKQGVGHVDGENGDAAFLFKSIFLCAVKMTELPMKECESIRSQCNQLIANETIDKETALGIMQLQFSMEHLVLSTYHAKQHEVEQLNNELKLVQMSSSLLEQVNTLSENLSTLQNAFSSNRTHLADELIVLNDKCNTIAENTDTSLKNETCDIKNNIDSLFKTINEMQPQLKLLYALRDQSKLLEDNFNSMAHNMTSLSTQLQNITVKKK